MTVEEAREKVCILLEAAAFIGFMSATGNPFGVTSDQLKISADGKRIEVNPSCIANKCGFWRWCDPNTKHEGYCGLAGKEGAE